MRGRLFLLAILAALAAPAWAEDPAIVFPPGARAEQDGFFAGMINTNDPEGFAQAWVGSRPLEPHISERAVRGRELRTLILFQGCRPAADGKCNLTGRFTYSPPDGAESQSVDVVLWDRPPRAGGYVAVALGPVLIVDPPDPMGRWTLHGEIRDNVRGTTLTLRTTIVVDTPPVAAPVAN
jgi:hypothetical protein